MSKYIDAEKLKAHIEAKMEILWDKLPDADKEHPTDIELRDLGMYMAMEGLIDDLDSLQQEQPEPYFYCKYGGIMPLCSDCKRNHSNSSFKTEEITTWYTPSCGTKQCIDYIQREQPEVDLEKYIENEINHYGLSLYEASYGTFSASQIDRIIRNAFELGLNARKEE